MLVRQHYVADQGLAVSVFLALQLRRPLFLEGEAGVGKTALATAVADALGTELIRLQCYEGLDVSHAVYEWDYARQLVELRILEATARSTGDGPTRALQRRIPDQAAAASRDRPRAFAAGGAADRRD